MSTDVTHERVRTDVLDVAFERRGPAAGPSVVLLHGFPYDVRAYDEAAAILAELGADVVVPYLRGYGPTRFLSEDTMRSGQQAALAHDLHDLVAALDLRTPVVAGYDWGGRAACLVAMLWPELVGGLVTVDGYNVHDIAHSRRPAEPEQESRLWYQYYLHGERGRAGLAEHRAAFARLLWHQWSPGWELDDATFDAMFDATAPSFDNPDFVDVVVHSYRHRYGLVPGDAAYQASEDLIAALPPIEVPTVVVDAAQDALGPPEPTEVHRSHFTDLVDHVVLPAGHDLPQEDPAGFAEQVARLLP